GRIPKGGTWDASDFGGVDGGVPRVLSLTRPGAILSSRVPTAYYRFAAAQRRAWPCPLCRGHSRDWNSKCRDRAPARGAGDRFPSPERYFVPSAWQFRYSEMPWWWFFSRLRQLDLPSWRRLHPQAWAIAHRT